MPGYTVMEANLPREWEGQYGKMLSYDLVVSGPDGQVECELAQKPETPAPKVGDLIQGTIQPGKNGYPGKLKKEKPQQGGRFSGGGKPGKPRDPSERDSIERQVAYKGAVELVAARGAVSPQQQKDTLTELFHHGLSLIQTGQTPGRSTNPPVPQNTEQPESMEQPPPPDEPPGITIEHIRQAYKDYKAREQDAMEADAKWQQKLAAEGLTVETLGQASQQQFGELLAFLDPAPF